LKFIENSDFIGCRKYSYTETDVSVIFIVQQFIISLPGLANARFAESAILAKRKPFRENHHHRLVLTAGVLPGQ
jgi:hypothetical protein